MHQYDNPRSVLQAFLINCDNIVVEYKNGEVFELEANEMHEEKEIKKEPEIDVDESNKKKEELGQKKEFEYEEQNRRSRIEKKKEEAKFSQKNTIGSVSKQIFKTIKDDY